MLGWGNILALDQVKMRGHQGLEGSWPQEDALGFGGEPQGSHLVFHILGSFPQTPAPAADLFWAAGLPLSAALLPRQGLCPHPSQGVRYVGVRGFGGGGGVLQGQLQGKGTGLQFWVSRHNHPIALPAAPGLPTPSVCRAPRGRVEGSEQGRSVLGKH